MPGTRARPFLSALFADRSLTATNTTPRTASTDCSHPPLVPSDCTWQLVLLSRRYIDGATATLPLYSIFSEREVILPTTKACITCLSLVVLRRLKWHHFFVLFFCFIPSIVLALLSRSLPVAAQVRGHIAGPPPRSPLRYVPSFLSREDLSIFSPRRLASNCTPTHAARRSQRLILFIFYFCVFANSSVKSLHGWESNSSTNGS